MTRELEYAKLRKRRPFNPKMLQEWWKVEIPQFLPYSDHYFETRKSHLWCSESCRGRWSNGNPEEVNWRALQKVNASYNNVCRTFYFKYRGDAIRFLCLFT